MRRRKIVRFQLALLALAAAALVGRNLWVNREPGAEVVLKDIEARALKHEMFQAAAPARIVVSGVGSLGEGGGEAGFNAYGWIVRRGSHEVVWRMDPARVQRGRGTLATQHDTLSILPGLYDVYFSSFGNHTRARERGGSFFRRLADSSRRWQNESSKWRMTVAGLTPEAIRGVQDGDEAAAEAAEGLLWSSAPVRNQEDKGFLFEVGAPAALRVYAMGEFEGEHAADFGWIEEAQSGRKVWEMRAANTRPGGGAPRNRYADEPVRLAPGLYRAHYKSNGRHAYDDWEANPPFDPAAWGMALYYASDPAAVAAFDPWTSRAPIAKLDRVGSGVRRSIGFELLRPTPVVVQATGEVKHDNRYDYGWLEDASTGRKIWEMGAEDRTAPAGGDSKNREETAVFTLEPGRYVLHFRTDDSHAFDDWNSAEPTHPERWGAAVFPLARTLPPGVAVVDARYEEQRGDGGEPREPPCVEDDCPAPPPPLPPGAGIMGEAVVEHVRLGNDTDINDMLIVHEPGAYQIYALGELTESGRYDYGWIERAADKERVWEMTWENTRPAGGSDRNRAFRGEVFLEPGHYRVRFKTDMAHAFGSFKDSEPDDPERWGITIAR